MPHLAQCMNHPVEPVANGTQYFQPAQADFIEQENTSLTLTPRGDMVMSAGKFESQWSGHQESVTKNVGMLAGPFACDTFDLAGDVRGYWGALRMSSQFSIYY